MIIELTHTDAAAVMAALTKARRNIGTTTGLVYTLIVRCDINRQEEALKEAMAAARQHPSRVLLVVQGRSEKTNLDATIRSGEGVPGDVITLKVSGDLVEHADSVVLPLLLPDLPVVVWWPYASPENPGDDVIGKLANRRITDAAGDKHPLQALAVRASHLTPGDTDLTWTRLTPWRALLASALDQTHAEPTQITVEAARGNAPAELLAAWLQARLKCGVLEKHTRGPGITGVRMEVPEGEISLVRIDGRLAIYSVPGQPERQVALRRRSVEELLGEELRRIDPDDIFDEAAHQLVKREAAAALLAKSS